MIFNNKLLRNIPEDVKEIAMALCFFVQEDINPMNIFDDTEHIVKLLLDNGAIYYDYTDKKYRLSDHLYISENYTGDIANLVDKMRLEFSKEKTGLAGLMGNKASIISLMLTWFNDNTATEEEILKACQAYINNCRITDTFIRRLPNFILTSTGESLLTEWIEEIRNNDTHNSINDII